MTSYYEASAGLRKMYIAAIGVIISAILAIIPVLSIVGAIGAIVFAVVSFVGLCQAGKEIEGCKTAMILTIVGIVVNIFEAILGESIITSLLSSILDMAVTYFVCMSVSEVLSKEGHEDVAAKGTKAWKVYFICDILMIVCKILLLIPGINIFAIVPYFLVGLAGIYASIIYMIFLKRSSEAL